MTKIICARGDGVERFAGCAARGVCMTAVMGPRGIGAHT